jgi:PAS domain S-box-containing protein
MENNYDLAAGGGGPSLHPATPYLSSEYLSLGLPALPPETRSDEGAAARWLDIVLDVLTDAVTIYDATGRVLHMNAANRELFGIDPAQNDYRNLDLEQRMAAFHIRETDGEPMPAERWPISRILRGESLRGATALDIRVRTLDGCEKVVSATGAALYDRMGAVTAAVCIFRDVTARNQMTQELSARVAQLQAIFQAMADPMLVYDKDGRILEMNAAAEELTGYTLTSPLYAQSRRDEMPLIKLFDQSGRELDRHERPATRMLTGEVFAGAGAQELWLEKPNGERAAISLTGAPVRDYRGAIVGAVNIPRDVTERRRLERQKEEFLSIASHELRTPLTSIKTLAQFVSSELAKAGRADLEQSARIMERSIARMERLVNDLLDVSRIEAGKLALRATDCDLVALCRQVIDETRRATARDIIFSSDLESAIGVVDGDRVGQALSNLLSNAIKYSTAEHPVTVALARVGGETLLSVSDHGTGIAGDALPHLFERFYRAPGIEVQYGSGVGLGLGLYIARELVERHGGRLWAESEPGVGSTFWVALPLAAIGDSPDGPDATGLRDERALTTNAAPMDGAQMR